MNILDQRVLIPNVSPEVVWATISNVAQNPAWQADCRSVSFLSTSHTGQGVRWRYTNEQGRECVVETTAWYEGLGYEYTFVDGAPYRTSRGRIRLQEVPEGTVVQWTFHYEPGGVLGGVRNAIASKRQLESAMADSLKMLSRYILQANAGRTVHEAKSLMRDAPDYEARAKYQPRHPSAAKVEGTANPVIPEPPIGDEDTRPRVPLSSTEVAPTSVSAESEDLSRFEPPRRESTETQPAVVSVPATEVETATEQHQRVQVESDAGESQAESVVEQPAVAEPVLSPEELAMMDTSQISVFDVFGLPKPSDTQEMRKISVSEAEAITTTQSAVLRAEASTVELPYGSSGRVGRRVLTRRNMVKLRRS